jgi:hypothetical protein
VSGESGGPPPGEDELDRRLRELTEEISGKARIREPSAAERAKTAAKRPAKRRGGGRAVGWSVTAVVLAGAALFAWHQEGRSGLGGPTRSRAPRPITEQAGLRAEYARLGGLVRAGTTTLIGTVDYRFVYAVEPPHAPADWMRIVGQVSGYVEFNDWQDPGGAIRPWDVSAFPAEAGARCGMTDGYDHPDYPGGPPLKVQPTGAPVNPYSMNNPPVTGICQNTTGT